ncbi:helix-turn-helix domain-containing protein [Rhodococcus sp. HM1]|nr:helix-turn-helix domain-containing protein [Rhodococcus sp. HM1]
MHVQLEVATAWSGKFARPPLAELSGAHVQTIGALERGDQRPSLDLALRISAAFDRPVQEVFFWADSSTITRDR